MRPSSSGHCCKDRQSLRRPGAASVRLQIRTCHWNSSAWEDTQTWMSGEGIYRRFRGHHRPSLWERLSGRAEIELLHLPERPGARSTAGAEKMPSTARTWCSSACRMPPPGGMRLLAAGCNQDAGHLHRLPHCPGLGLRLPGAVEDPERIQQSRRVAVPGCYASGFIALGRPLVRAPAGAAGVSLQLHSLIWVQRRRQKDDRRSMRARPAPPASWTPPELRPRAGHKHLPEMQKVAGLDPPAAVCPVVGDYYSGMATTMLLPTAGPGGRHQRPGRGPWPGGVLQGRPAWSRCAGTSRCPRTACTATLCRAPTGWNCT